jgi:ankyrin repeat protein
MCETEEIFKALINIPSDEYEPIHLAIKEGDICSVEKCLNEGVDIDTRTKKGSTPLHMALSYANFDMVRFLLKNNANPNLKNEFGYPCLHYAVIEDDLELAKLLVIHGAKLNLTEDDQGLYPIHYASGESLELVKYLIAHGSEKNPVIKGWTLMHSAAHNGKNDIVKYLFNELGLDINATTDFDETPLELAEREGHKSTVKLIKKLIAKSKK